MILAPDALARIHGLAVFSECLAGGLAWADQRRQMGSGSASDAIRDNALYKILFTLLLFSISLTLGQANF